MYNTDVISPRSQCDVCCKATDDSAFRAMSGSEQPYTLIICGECHCQLAETVHDAAKLWRDRLAYLNTLVETIGMWASHNMCDALVQEIRHATAQVAHLRGWARQIARDGANPKAAEAPLSPPRNAQAAGDRPTA